MVRPIQRRKTYCPKILTFQLGGIQAGCQTMQPYRILQCAATRAMLFVPTASEKWGSINFSENKLLFKEKIELLHELKYHGKTKGNTCSESPHLRKAEKDCRRVQMYWPPTVATQYQIFWATVNPGPSKPVLTAGGRHIREQEHRKKRRQNGQNSFKTRQRFTVLSASFF